MVSYQMLTPPVHDGRRMLPLRAAETGLIVVLVCDVCFTGRVSRLLVTTIVY